MKTFKRLTTLAVVLAMVMTMVLGGMTVAKAEGDLIKVVVEASGEDNVVMKIVATEAFTVTGLVGKITPPDGFTYVADSATSFDNTMAFNPTTLKFVCESQTNLAEGDSLLEATFVKPADFVEGQEYTFTVVIAEEDGFYGPTEDYPLTSNTLTGVYKEESTAPVFHTVTFMNGDEEFMKVDDVVDGQPVAKPDTTPTAPEGQRFAYWAKDGAKYDFSTPVTEDITLTAVFEDIPSHEIEITKKVNADIEYPEITFTFEVGEGEYEGPIENVTAPAIDDATVTMSGTEDEATATINLDGITWPAGGVYTYPLTEKDDGEEGWEYDDTEYELVVTVEPNENTGALEISNVFVKKGTEKGEVEFENTYAPTTDLTIKKVVAADPKPTDGYGTEEFSFTVVFDEGFEGTINGEAYTFEANVPYPFTLKDGDEIVIGNIPAGITYTVVEAETPYYTATAEVVNGTEQPTVPDGEFGEGITVGPIEIAAAAPGTNKVTVTNTYSITPPTGVTIRGEMIGIIVLALVALAGSFVLSRKLRRARD